MILVLGEYKNECFVRKKKLIVSLIKNEDIFQLYYYIVEVDISLYLLFLVRGSMNFSMFLGIFLIVLQVQSFLGRRNGSWRFVFFFRYIFFSFDLICLLVMFLAILIIFFRSCWGIGGSSGSGMYFCSSFFSWREFSLKQVVVMLVMLSGLFLRVCRR